MNAHCPSFHLHVMYGLFIILNSNRVCPARLQLLYFLSLPLPTSQSCISIPCFLISPSELLRTEHFLFRGVLLPQSGPLLPSAVQHRQAGDQFPDECKAQFFITVLLGGLFNGAGLMSTFNEMSIKQKMSISKRKETIFMFMYVPVCNGFLLILKDVHLRPHHKFSLFNFLLNLDQNKYLSLKNSIKQHTIQVL